MSKKRNTWSTWFTSDPHFGHDNVIDFCNRPYGDMDEMLDKIRDKWNKRVKPEDQVIFVGDVFFHFKKHEAKAYLDSLNGKKILVRGNHDQKPRQMNGMGFDFVCEEMVLWIANERVTVSHYPFRAPRWKHEYYNLRHKLFKFLGIKGKSWKIDKRFYTRRPENKGQFLLHGHTHSKEKVRDRMIHVGMDAWKCEPIPMHEIANMISDIKRKEEEYAASKKGFRGFTRRLRSFWKSLR